MLRMREQLLRKRLKEAMEEDPLDKKRKGDAPVVALVGYTNAGKTSLAKRFAFFFSLKE